MSPATPRRPVKTRLALLLVLAVYPLITGLLYLVLPLTEGWTIWQRTLVLAPVMVASIVWIVSPLIHARFGRFLTGA